MMRTITAVMSMSLFLAGCGGGGGSGDEDTSTTSDVTDAEDAASDVEAEPDAITDPVEEEIVPPPCNEGTRWTPGTSAYTDVTADWGLVGVLGVRINVTDFDGDGWPDLMVRNGGSADNFNEGGVRRKWLLRNTGDGFFEDVTQESGLLQGRVDTGAGFGRPGEVWASGDVDNDGDLDVYTGTTRTDPTDATAETSELMINNGDGTFSLGPEGSDARFQNMAASTSGVAFVDFDRDGNLDLWVTHNADGSSNPMQDRLLKGDGTGSFVDVTAEMGMVTRPWNLISDLNEGLAHSWGWSALACDLNNDGIPELMASSYGRAPNHLWRGDDSGGDLMYMNESVDSGYAFDHRDDWTQDLNAQCYCEDNPTAEDCDLAPTPEDYTLCEQLYAGFGGMYRWDHTYGREPFRLGGNSGATTCADIDNDGYMDLLTGEIVHFDVGPPSDPAEIMHNLADPLVRFERPGNDVTGLLRVHLLEDWNDGDMTNAVFDFDNDGWQDVYIGDSDYPDSKGLLFHQDAPMVFTRLESTEYFDHHRAHGVAVADFDRDGDLDVVVGHSLMRCDTPIMPWECRDTPQIRMFENLMGDGSNWVQIHLVGTEGSNRSAIGARVEVTAGDVTQTQQVDGGHGHYGTQNDLVLHFGLGTACEADVTIHWPDAAQSTQTETLFANMLHEVSQD